MGWRHTHCAAAPAPELWCRARPAGGAPRWGPHEPLTVSSAPAKYCSQPAHRSSPPSPGRQMGRRCPGAGLWARAELGPPPRTFSLHSPGSSQPGTGDHRGRRRLCCTRVTVRSALQAGPGLLRTQHLVVFSRNLLTLPGARLLPARPLAPRWPRQKQEGTPALAGQAPCAPVNSREPFHCSSPGLQAGEAGPQTVPAGGGAWRARWRAGGPAGVKGCLLGSQPRCLWSGLQPLW